MASTAEEPRLRSSGLPFALALGAALTLQLAFYAIAPFIALPSPLGGLFAFAAVALSVLVAGLTVPWLALRRTWILLLPVGALVSLARLHVDASSVAAAALVLLSLLTLGALVGGFVGSRVEAPGHLLVVAAVSSLADLYSVLTPGAPSHTLAASELLLPLVAIPWCPLGSRSFLPILGLGDVVMSALYLASARIHHLGRARMFGALALGYALCLAALLRSEEALPALPFLGVAVVLLVPEARRLPPSDRSRAAIGVLVFVALFGALALR